MATMLTPTSLAPIQRPSPPSEMPLDDRLPNGHSEVHEEKPVRNGGPASDEESELSEPADNVPASASPPLGQHDLHRSSTLEQDDMSPEEQDNAVAEEDVDEDYDEDITMHDTRNGIHGNDYSSDDSIRPPKRKAIAVEENDDYMRRDPDLYGLRRSHRARPTRALVETSDEDFDSDAAQPPRKRPRQSYQSSKQPTPVIETPSESDDDAYGGRRAKLSKKQKRRFLESAGNLAPPHAEVRFSTRRAGKVSNYNEDDDDDLLGEDESEMTPSYYYAPEQDNSPAIDIILNHRLLATVTTPSQSRDDYEFKIKWQQKAHYHSTWETIESLASVRSLRRLDNYVKKVLNTDIRVHSDATIAPEDKEKWIMDREQYVDALDDHNTVERVIACRDEGEGSEYFVKWKGLFYDQCTWETEELVSQIAQSEIDRYFERSRSLPVSDKKESEVGSRSTFVRINDQPDYIKYGTLRDFQRVGLNFLAFNWTKGKNVVLADEMGLGKTIQTIAFINWLRHDRDQQGPFLVTVPLSTMPAWAETFDNWTPDINYVVYNGNQTARNIIRDYELLIDGSPRRPKFHVLLTTYEYVLADAHLLSQIKWQFMAVDEAHRLKNRDSQLYDRLREIKANCRLLITGTPVQNNLGELSALFDFLSPGLINIDENMDLTTEEASAKIAKLTEDIKPFMIRRTKQKVEKDLPPKSEKIIRVELSDIQLEYYKNILTKNYAALNQGAKGQKQSLLNIVMELKKASNHPFMFPSAEERLVPEGARREEVLRALVTSSGKMMLLDQLLTKLKRDGHRVLIFSQMVRMLDILGDYMEYRGHAYQRLDGTIAAAPRRIAIDHFNAPESNDFCFLLSTRAGGLGINLMTADTVIIFDSDWNPQADLQAMARAHRIGQVKPVSVYRLVSKETIEEEILERARNKLMLEYLTIQQGVTDKETQARRNALVGEPGSSSEISRILKKRGQKMFEQTDNQKKLEELDLDAVLEKAEDYKVEQPDGTDADGGEEFLRSFDFVDVKVDELSWDDIIPAEQLEQLKVEEQKRKDEQYLADVIEQNRPRNRNATDEDREARQQRRLEQRENMDSESESDEGPRADPSRPLNEREYRYLIRAHLRYGSIDDRTEEFIADARLRGRDMAVVRGAMDEVLGKANALVKEEQDRMDLLEKTANRPITKKDKKAVLFELHGVKRINADTLLDRPGEMRLLRDVTTAVADPKDFRILEATKTAGYSCPWGAREDGMLCVGIHRHGYGAWEKIRDDPDFGLQEKFFLEEHRVDKKAEREEGKNAKSPGAVHLVRRADYLLSVLKSKFVDDPIAKKAVENHHRNNKKHGIHQELTANTSSPAPSSHRKPHRDSEKSRHRFSNSQRDSADPHHAPRPDSRYGHNGRDAEPRDRDRERDRERDKERKHRPSDDHPPRHDRHGSDHRRQESSMTNGAASGVNDQMMSLVMKPVRENLKRIKSATKSAVPDSSQRANILREQLTVIGKFILEQLTEVDDEADKDSGSLELRFW